MATFCNAADENGDMTYTVYVKADESMFIRLRGTNMPANVPFETDAEGNPLADSLASDNIYGGLDNAVLTSNLFDGVEYDTTSKLDEVAEAYADVWFYSNPIYIEVTGNTLKADICKDGTVDLKDLSILATEWLQTVN